MEEQEPLAQGTAIWTPATTHLSENIVANVSEAILVELKKPMGEREEGRREE